MSNLPVSRRTFVAGTDAALGTAVLDGSAIARAAGGKGDSDDTGGRPSVIAHRGYAGLYPQNTLGAFSRAARTADVIEIDVLPAADGTVAVFHDDKLDALTDAEGYVWDHPWSEVTEAEVLDSGETIPSLAEALEAIPADVGVNVEFKNPGSAEMKTGQVCGDELGAQMDLWRPMAERALGLIGRADNDVLVSSFSEAALAVVRELDPDLPVAYLFWNSIREGLRITETYDCEALHPPMQFVTETSMFEPKAADPADTTDLVGWAHERGKAVNVWTVATWHQADQLAAVDVDAVIADYPNLFWTDGNAEGDEEG